MILTAIALLIGSTVIGSIGTIALFEHFVRKASSQSSADPLHHGDVSLHLQ